MAGLIREAHQRLPLVVGERFQAGHTLPQENPAIRLAFAGDPVFGIPPCAAYQGPGNHKLGAVGRFGPANVPDPGTTRKPDF